MNDLFLFDLEETSTKPAQESVTLPSATRRASEIVRRWACASNSDLRVKLPVGSGVVLGNGSGRAVIVAVVGPFDDKGRNYWNVLLEKEGAEERYTVITGVRETEGGFVTLHYYDHFILENDAPQKGDNIGVITMPFYSTVGQTLALGQEVGVGYDKTATLLGRRGNWLLIDNAGEEEILMVAGIHVFRSYTRQIIDAKEAIERAILALPTVQTLQAKRTGDLHTQLNTLLPKESVDEADFKSFYALVKSFADEGDEARARIEKRLGFTFEHDGKNFEVSPWWSTEYMNGLTVSSTEGIHSYGLSYQADLSVIGKREALIAALHVPHSKVKEEPKKKMSQMDKMTRKHMRERVTNYCDETSSLPEVAGNAELMGEIAAIKARLGANGTADADLERAEQRLCDIREIVGRKRLSALVETVLAPGFSATESELSDLAGSMRVANELTGYDETARSFLDLLSGRVIACEVGDGHWAAIWNGDFHGAVSSSGFYSGAAGENSMASRYAVTVAEAMKSKRSREQQVRFPQKFAEALTDDLVVIDEINDRRNLLLAAAELSEAEESFTNIYRACRWLESDRKDTQAGFMGWLTLAKVEHYLCYSFEPDVAVMEAMEEALSVYFSNIAGIPVRIGSRQWEIDGDDFRVDASRISSFEQAEGLAKLLAECKRDGVDEVEFSRRIKNVLPASSVGHEGGLLGMDDGDGREEDSDSVDDELNDDDADGEGGNE